MSERRRCSMTGCTRMLPKGENGWICRQCWSVIPACYKLALQEHDKLYDHPWPLVFEGEDTDPVRPQEWRALVRSSWETLVAFMQANIWGWRYLKRTDPDAWELAD